MARAQQAKARSAKTQRAKQQRARAQSAGGQSAGAKQQRARAQSAGVQPTKAQPAGSRQVKARQGKAASASGGVKPRGGPSRSTGTPQQPAPPHRRHRTGATRAVARRHSRDIGGLGAIVVGLLVAGSVWMSVAGPLGNGVDWVLAATVGLVRMALPVGLVALGVVSLAGGRRGSRRGGELSIAAQESVQSSSGSADGTREQTHASPGSPSPVSPSPNSPRTKRVGSGHQGDPIDGPQAVHHRHSDSMLRAGLGGLLLVLSAAGLLHLARGRPGVRDSVEVLGDAGGALGVAVGGFMHAWTDVWGSVLLLVFVALVGLIIATQLSVSWLVGGVVWFAKLIWLSVIRPAGRGVRRLVVQLFSDIKEAPEATPQASHAQASQVPTEPPGLAGRSDEMAAPAQSLREQPAGTSVAGRSKSETLPAPATSAGRSDKMSKWQLPSLDLLMGTPAREVDRSEALERGELLQETLERFGVPTRPLEPVIGPTVTRFVLELGEGIKVAKLESLRKDIAYAMASPDVRILAPIPGRRAIGVEVPNLDRHVVRLGDILRSSQAAQAEHPLEVAVGRDINGHAVMMHLAKTPHVLIAGATGAGKSSCLNSLITSVLMRSTPEDVRMILVDPKRVEMGQYDRVPHLLTAPVTDPRKAANALAWAVREMERRYDVLHRFGYRDITGYNAAVRAGRIPERAAAKSLGSGPLSCQRLPFVLVVVDELADLMMVAARDVEESIARIAQMARAVGIHLVIATQRPSVNVITGVIKANIPARMAFAVSSLTDSRVILDQPGAERLVGRGDLLWLAPSSSTPHRIQGCWVTEEEVRSVVAHWVAQQQQEQQQDVGDDPMLSTNGFNGDVQLRIGAVVDEPDLGDAPAMLRAPAAAAAMPVDITEALPGVPDDDDELLDKAMALVVQTQLGSTSMLQRKLRVGFARAGRIMDLLEQRGVVGPSTGSKAREVLVTQEELEARRRS